MFRASKPLRGGLVDQLIPGWKDRLWNMYSNEFKKFKIGQQHSAFESWVKEGRWVNRVMGVYNSAIAPLKPSQKHRKPGVDYKRQIERGTLHHGKWYQGPHGSDYRPGNTFDRLENVKAPFTEAEWETRKQYRSYDLVQFTLICFGVFAAYKLTTEVPVVWCEEEEK